jgi:hypothetical protein
VGKNKGDSLQMRLLNVKGIYLEGEKRLYDEVKKWVKTKGIHCK